MTIAVAGNPNTGKTTIFNGLTGSRQRIGNWPGVTVERKEGILTFDSIARFLSRPFLPEETAVKGGIATTTATRTTVGDGPVTVVDLPGIYALSATSEDEIIARDYLLSGEPDLVVDVLDAANLERNLYLTLQLIELGLPLLVVLNMMDLAERRGIRIEAQHLAEHLGVPVVAVSAVKSDAGQQIKKAIHGALSERRASVATISYPPEVEQVLQGWESTLSAITTGLPVSERWLGLKLLERDAWVTERVVAARAFSTDTIEERISELAGELGEDPDVILADSRYGFIHGLSRHVVRRRLDRRSITDRIDRVVMSRALGIPLFLAVMYLVFWVTIAFGGAFIDFFDLAFGALVVDGPAVVLDRLGSPSWVTAFVAGGIGMGIRTVATFVPVIFFMFLMLSLLEDSGYMARAAFVMDRFMRWIGLPGKSFVPMMVGFGCTVPAILSTRTLDSAKDRYMTSFMAPFMSCGARLPVYALFATAFFPSRAGLVVFSLYVIGIVLAVLTGLLLKHTLFRGAVSHFIMELPPYHAPRPRHILRSAGGRLKVFVLRAGLTITVAVAILSSLNSLGVDGTLGNEGTDRSLLAVTGKAITPLVGPAGIEPSNWPATVGLFAGMFAKEAVVGTLSSLYSQNAAADGNAVFRLGERLREAVATVPANLAGLLESMVDPLGSRELLGNTGDSVVFRRMRQNFSPTGAYSYLLFVLIYFPCVSALAAAIREMGAGYGWLLAAYTTILAWTVATLVYQTATGQRPVLVLAAIGVVVVIPLVFLGLRRVMRTPGAGPSRSTPSGRNLAGGATKESSL
jgi:ferrous iron transport protein B